MKAVHVVPRIHEEASGPTYSVTRLCAALAELGVETSLHVTHSAGQSPDNYKIHTHGSLDPGGRYGYSPAMKRALRQEVQSADILHNHSLWMMPNIYPGTIRRPDRCKLICSPRGTLSDWAWNRSRWKKWIIWQLGQKKLLERCDLFHATAEIEYDEIRRRGLGQPVAIIPNGVEIPSQETIKHHRAAQADQRKLLFLARIHPKKGIEILLDAWDELHDHFAEWSVDIVGTGDSGYIERLASRIKQQGLPRIGISPPVYGGEKSQAYASAELYILPTYSENFGLTIAEALAHGLPVITTDQTPWTALDSQQAGWCIPLGLDSLIGTLETALGTSPEKLRQMGARGRAWMERDFAWPVIGKQMVDTYQWLIGQADQPIWVNT